MNKKILHLNFSDDGGAGIAVKRINECLIKSNVNSKILVAEKNTSDKNVIYNQSRLDNFFWKNKKKISRNLKFFFKTKNKNTHTISFFNSNILSQIKKYNPDFLNIHWIGNEFISLEQIKKINIPIFWTLHDMWLYCGAEHYTFNNRFIEGYLKNNRPQTENGFDLNRWVWNRKKKNLPNNFEVIATSDWQFNNAKKSNLLKNKKIHKLFLPIDTNFWKPVDKRKSRESLSWQDNVFYFLFGFSNYDKKYIKGLDIAIDIFKKTKKKYPEKKFILNVFGEVDKKYFQDEEINFLGKIEDENKLKLIYSASNLLINTSRQESFGQIALESLSTGLPIIILDNTGTKDLIKSLEMGFIFKDSSLENINDFFVWLNNDQLNLNSEKIHRIISENFSYETISKNYINLIEDFIEKNKFTYK